MGPRRWLLAHAPGLFARCFEPDPTELGLLGEEFAARHLAAQGWRLLGRRLATRAGEVDLFAHDGSGFVCVEVKSARVGHVPRPRGAAPELSRLAPEPAQRLGRAQLGRLERSARLLARQHGGGAAGVRIDLVEVELGPARGRVELRHHRDWAGRLRSQE